MPRLDKRIIAMMAAGVLAIVVVLSFVLWPRGSTRRSSHLAAGQHSKTTFELPTVSTAPTTSRSAVRTTSPVQTRTQSAATQAPVDTEPATSTSNPAPAQTSTATTLVDTISSGSSELSVTLNFFAWVTTSSGSAVPSGALTVRLGFPDPNLICTSPIPSQLPNGVSIPKGIPNGTVTTWCHYNDVGITNGSPFPTTVSATYIPGAGFAPSSAAHEFSNGQ